MKTLLMLCGPSGAGKSYWAKKVIEMDGVIPVKYFSRDAVRFEMVPETDPYFSKEDAVFKEWIRRIQEALDANEESYIIADATHINERSRAKTLDHLTLGDTIIITVSCNPGVRICLERNEQRTGRARVPKNVITQMCYNYVAPHEDEKYHYDATLVAELKEDEE